MDPSVYVVIQKTFYVSLNLAILQLSIITQVNFLLAY